MGGRSLASGPRPRRLDREQLSQLVHRRLARLIRVVELDQLLDRGEERRQVEQEGEELSDRQGAVEHHPAADEQQHRLPDDTDRLVGRAVDGSDGRGLDVGVAMLADEVGVMDHVVSSAVVGDDDPHPGQALGEIGQHDARSCPARRGRSAPRRRGTTRSAPPSPARRRAG